MRRIVIHLDLDDDENISLDNIKDDLMGEIYCASYDYEFVKIEEEINDKPED